MMNKILAKIFWFCIAFSVLFLFHRPIQNITQSQVVIQKIRGGARDPDVFISPLKPERARTGQQDSSRPKGPGPRELMDDPKPKLQLSRRATGNEGSGSGSGGDNSWEDENAIPPKSSWINDPDYWTPNDFSKNKKKDQEETCNTDENSQDVTRIVIEKLDESNAVRLLVKTALKNQRVKSEYVQIKRRLEEGINPVDITKKSVPVAKNMVLIKGGQGRYLVEVSGDQVTILGMAARGNNKNLKAFESLMNEMYDVDLQY
jgi:hypothetical protein